MAMFNGSFARWFGGAGATRTPAKPRTAPLSTQFVPSQASAAAGVHAERKDLLKLVLRELLQHNGIPESWLSADLLRISSSRREHGIHVRLLVRQWEPRLMLHGVALEQDFLRRLIALDPDGADWLRGFSWQFTLPDLSACPGLPPPASWTAAAAPDTIAAPADAPPTTTAGDVIEGPVVLPRAQDDVRADLARLLALRDDDLQRHGPGEDGFAATRPVEI